MIKINKTNDDISKVHVIYKTHLDIGFTDLARDVTKQYIESYIPNAIKLAEELEEGDSQAQFIWTTGSWLIHEYFKQADANQLHLMKQAIDKGYITWHGLPFTTHSELMDVNLFNYGLSIGKKLDKQFSKRTISAKMTDVPGHTKAIIPHMEKQGIKYLHLGVNPASTVPDVPSIFLWKGSDGSELIVNYADNYGDVLEIDGLNEVMVFAHTGDNCGPPSKVEIEKEFNKLQEQFPNAEIIASTMDNFAEKVIAHKHKLPIVYEEIGDSWIHGVGTDPKKVSEYRELLRLRNRWIEQGDFVEESEEYINFSDALLLIAEHTWGLDEKKFLSDYKHYAKEDFQKARKQNYVTEDAVPDKYSYISLFAMDEADSSSGDDENLWDNRSYKFFESSWEEQREYVTTAVNALSPEKQEQVKKAFRQLQPQQVNPSFKEDISINIPYELGSFIVMFSEDGSIKSLIDKNEKEWVNQDGGIGTVQYEAFGIENYNTWFEQYVKNTDKHFRWSDADQGKPGLDLVSPYQKHEQYKPHVVHLRRKKIAEGDMIQVELQFPNQSIHAYGAPRELIITYTFYSEKSKIDIDLNWFDKDANRMPEALWLSFNLNVANNNIWTFDKLNEKISPLHVVKNGNRNLHAVNHGVFYEGADGNVEVLTKDAPLLSFGEKRLLQFDNTFACMSGGLHFNLLNNIWGTNFPMWYEDDAKFRFSIELNSY